jgi:UDP-glucose 4-epimerase
MKIFVTGGTGFIGKHLMENLNDEKNELLLLSPVPKDDFPWLKNKRGIEVLEGNLSSANSWRGELEKFQPEGAVHLAWEALPDYGPQASVRNLKYGLDLVEMLAELGCKSFLSSGSCWEYGGHHGKMKEDLPVRPMNAFTAAKNSLNWLGSEIAKEAGMDFIWARIFYVYGPGQRETSLIPHLINSLKNGEKPELKNPFAKNDFIYIDDVSRALCFLLEKSKSGVYNIGSGKLAGVDEIAKIIFDYFGKKYEFLKAGKKTPETDFYADISRIKKDTGWKPETGLREGIIKTINHISGKN